MVDAKKRASNMGHPAMVDKDDKVNRRSFDFAQDDRFSGGWGKGKCGDSSLRSE